MVCAEPMKMPVLDIAIPEIQPDEVLIKVARCGVCGTDVHIYKGEYIATMPVVLGHEFSGTAERVGKNVQNFKPGDRVTVEPNVNCEKCYFCQIEQRNQCLNWSGIGVTRNGAFAEYVKAPEKNTFFIGDLSFEEAAFIEPVSCALYGLQQTKIQLGAEVLIFGAGPMGLLLMQMANHGNAAKVVMVEPHNNRRLLAEQLGCRYLFSSAEDLKKNMSKIAPLGFDVVIDATGVPAVVESCFQYAKMGATILMFGVCPKEDKITISPFDIFKNDWHILGTFASCATFPQAIKMIQEKKVLVKSLLSHTLPLVDFSDVLKILNTDTNRMKIQIEP